MITLALMLADENNRKVFSEIIQELEKPLQDFATQLSKDMKDVTNNLAETTKAGLKLYADDIDDFVDSVIEFCDALGGSGVEALGKFSRSAGSLAGEALNTLIGRLKNLSGTLKTFTQNVSTKGLDTLRSSMGKVANDIKNHVTQVFSLDSAYKKVAESIAYASKVGDLSRTLDVNTESFSNWADVVTDSGGNIDTFASSLGNVKKYLNKNGMSTDAFDYLLDISDQMKGMNTEDAKTLGASMGIDQNTVMLLKQGSTSLQAMLEEQKKLGGVTEEDAQTINAFNKMMNTLNHMIRSVALQIGTAILPALTWFLNKVKGVIGFLSEHESFAKGFFIGIAAVLLTTLLPALWAAFAPLLPTIGLMLLFGIAFGALGWLVNAVISNFGEILDWLWGVASGVFDGLSNAFFAFVDAIGSGISTIIGFFTFWLDMVFAIVNAIFTLFTEGPAAAINFFKNAILDGLNALYDKLPNWVKKLFSGVKGFFSSDETIENTEAIASADKENKALTKGADALKGAQNTSQLLASSGSKPTIANNNQVSYQNNFKITSNDPKEVQRAVHEEMNGMAQHAAEHFDNGVVA